MVKPFVYDQFCAGTNKGEIQKTMADIKRLGFAGVILCYGKELMVAHDNKFTSHLKANGTEIDSEIEPWKDGNLETLAMLGENDWLGMK